MQSAGDGEDAVLDLAMVEVGDFMVRLFCSCDRSAASLCVCVTVRLNGIGKTGEVMEDGVVM